MRLEMLLSVVYTAFFLLPAANAFLPDEVTTNLEPQAVLDALDDLFDQASQNLQSTCDAEDGEIFTAPDRRLVNSVDFGFGGQLSEGNGYAPPIGSVAVFASNFEVSYFPSYKVVKNFDANQSYVLYPCGNTKPLCDSPGIPEDMIVKFFETPLQTAAFTETVSLTFYEVLNLTSVITKADLGFVSSPCLQLLKESGNITQISEFQDQTSLLSELEEVDAVFISKFSSQTLQDLPNSVSFDTSTASGPLGRSEWIKFISLFFDFEELANGIFESVADRYICYADFFSNLLAEEAKPQVAWVSYSDFFGERWTISQASFKKILVTNAGARNYDINDLPLSLTNSSTIEANGDISFSAKEDFETAVASVDILIDETFTFSPSDYGIANVTSVLGQNSTAFEQESIWRVDGLISPGNGYDWFESTFPQADAVLQDIIGVIHGHETWNLDRAWLRNVALDETPVVISSEECESDVEQNDFVRREFSAASCEALSFVRGFKECQESPDLDSNGAVDVSDVVIIVNKLLGL